MLYLWTCWSLYYTNHMLVTVRQFNWCYQSVQLLLLTDYRRSELSVICRIKLHSELWTIFCQLQCTFNKCFFSFFFLIRPVVFHVSWTHCSLLSWVFFGPSDVDQQWAYACYRLVPESLYHSRHVASVTAPWCLLALPTEALFHCSLLSWMTRVIVSSGHVVLLPSIYYTCELNVRLTYWKCQSLCTLAIPYAFARGWLFFKCVPFQRQLFETFQREVRASSYTNSQIRVFCKAPRSLYSKIYIMM